MRFRTIIFILLFAVWPAGTGAQDSKFFRDKLGKPSEVYRHRSGVEVTVNYDDKGQVCRVYIADPTQEGYNHMFHRLRPVADEIVPAAMRGSLVGRAGDVGNCIEVEYRDHKRVFIEENRNACSKQWILIYFKRSSCPKPPQVRGLLPERD